MAATAPRAGYGSQSVRLRGLRSGEAPRPTASGWAVARRRPCVAEGRRVGVFELANPRAGASPPARPPRARGLD